MRSNDPRVVLLTIMVAMSGLTGCSGGDDTVPVDSDAELARLLGQDAHAIGTNLPGRWDVVYGGMKLEDGVFVTGNYTYTLTVPSATVIVYPGDPYYCVQASAIGPSGAVVVSSMDSPRSGEIGMPDYGEPCDEEYADPEPMEWVWENPIGLEDWDWLVSIPGTCLEYIENPSRSIDGRDQIPEVVSCDDGWDAMLLSKGALDAPDNAADYELTTIATGLCGDDLEAYGDIIDPDHEMELSVYHPDAWRYKEGDRYYVCLLVP